jgi:O-antigen ligase
MQHGAAARPGFGSGLRSNYRDGRGSALSFGGAHWVVGLLAVIALGVLWGYAVAMTQVNALFLCMSLLACIFIFLDFRIGVVLLIVLMPISASHIFPHQMMGITGLNPLNLLLAATFFSYLMRAVGDGHVWQFLPQPLLWLYVLPFLIAGLLGSRHVDEIASAIHLNAMVEFDNVGGYVRDLVAKPLFIVLFGLLVGAAVGRSADPRRFLAPMTVSMWVMSILMITFVAIAASSIYVLSGSNDRAFLAPLGMHANDLGRLYAVGYALLLFTFAGTRDYIARAMLLATMGIVTLALVLTFSRGAFMGFVVVNALFLLWRRSALTWIIGGLVAIVVAWKLPGVVLDRVMTGMDGSLNDLTAGRWDEIWLPLMPEIARSPLIGNGTHSIMWSDAMRAETILTVTHPHNAYIQALLDMGLIGLGLVIAYFVHVWRGFRKLATDATLPPSLRGFYEGAAAGLASFLIAALAGSSLMPAPEQAFLWLAIGMMYGQLSRRATEPVREPEPASKPETEVGPQPEPEAGPQRGKPGPQLGPRPGPQLAGNHGSN